MSPETETLLEVVGILDSVKLSYMLTGSLAKTFYATPRMTRDTDLVVEIRPDAVNRIVLAF